VYPSDLCRTPHNPLGQRFLTPLLLLAFWAAQAVLFDGFALRGILKVFAETQAPSTSKDRYIDDEHNVESNFDLQFRSAAAPSPTSPSNPNNCGEKRTTPQASDE